MNPALRPDPLAHGYPRPQLAREAWESLNGAWEFALDAEGRWAQPSDVAFDRTIAVPFAPETPASGVGHTGFFHACWYRRTFEAPRSPRASACICTSAPSTTARPCG